MARRRAQKRYREKKLQEVDQYKVQVMFALCKKTYYSSGHENLHALRHHLYCAQLWLCSADQGAQCQAEADGGGQESHPEGQRPP